MSLRRPLLLPLTPLYHAVAVLRRRMYRTGWLRSKRLACPVISVGSLSAGGAGKTPLVILLAETLKQHGIVANVLTRGYGRASTQVERVEPDSDPIQHGDEPVLMAQRGIPVFAGADRYQAGLLAEQSCPVAIHLLDDGFQHQQLARNIDIVLLTKQDVEDHLLPAGNLREPFQALRAADVIVLREEEANELRHFIRNDRGESRPSLWVIRRKLVLNKDEALPAAPLAFCGIARPEGFFRMLTAEGITPRATKAFRDHHRYNEADITRVVEQVRRIGADGFVTTEKDAVKLTSTMRHQLAAVGPLVAAGLQVEFADGGEAFQQLVQKLQATIL
ncbi:MAG: tetraacyldisaccharide 4'-kinase [Acidobacteriaceae bacterium]|nr:tetraacyldisaccharide 4'-kinase [Acidobacteriaceae bacterium]